ncbi:GIY-YIG nuclease family protein [Nocardia cyriacigeorgica]|uniref:GIY-YIG nuclease family protein n=1 Tax=Nocardia cyriacigeorgica TaxID=135487 RepID=UPI001894A8BB|nr:GIY-YIG nuclease family protein [Nocardia cyriacigeorgica]MBF6093476.1 GIY-YIG nuclease family protein [Nocardia cyriacigeorgica]
MSAGKSVRLFLADGTSGGLVTAEIINWTGHILSAPRSDLAELQRRPEVSRTGVYILLGDDPTTVGGVSAYIGEGDDVGRRIIQHHRPDSQGGKEFWNRVIVVTSKDANLTKAHARYLESRLIGIAAESGRATLVNGTAPTPMGLPESDISDMEYFITQIRIALPVLGVNMLRSAVPTVVNESSQTEVGVNSPVFELRLRKQDLIACARVVDGEFTVLADSGARGEWIGTDGSHDGYRRLREQLVQDGTIAPAPGGGLRFTRAHVFSSPSAAGAVVVGRSINGRTDWRTTHGLSYGEWEARGVESMTAESSEESIDSTSGEMVQLAGRPQPSA